MVSVDYGTWPWQVAMVKPPSELFSLMTAPSTVTRQETEPYSSPFWMDR